MTVTHFAIACFTCVGFSIQLLIFAWPRLEKRVNSYKQRVECEVKSKVEAGDVQGIFSIIREFNQTEDKLERNKTGWTLTIIFFFLSGGIALGLGVIEQFALQVAFWVVFCLATVFFIFTLWDLRSLLAIKET